MKTIYALFELSADGISYDIERLVLVSTNHQPLKAIAKWCRLLDSSSTFTVKEVQVDTKLSTLTYWHESESDYNHAYVKDSLTETKGTKMEMPILHSVSQSERDVVFSYLATDHKQRIEEEKFIQRQKRLGYYYQKPFSLL